MRELPGKRSLTRSVGLIQNSSIAPEPQGSLEYEHFITLGPQIISRIYHTEELSSRTSLPFSCEGLSWKVLISHNAPCFHISENRQKLNKSMCYTGWGGTSFRKSKTHDA